MDELTAVQQLLAEPPPGPDVTEAAWLKVERAALDGTILLRRDAGPGRLAGEPARRRMEPRRWPGWLTPLAAAAAVVAVVAGSLGLSGVIGRQSAGTSASAGPLAGVPRYFVTLPLRNSLSAPRAVVGATATGALLGTVRPPEPHSAFQWVTAAGDDRTFVLAAGKPPADGQSIQDWGAFSFYRLVLDRSGHPAGLTRLPIPPQKGITGVALSPDGHKLAVSVQPSHGQTGSSIRIFSLATGAEREWTWPGQGTVFVNSWEADSRTLLVREASNIHTEVGWVWQLRLLDTAAPAGNLRASSTRIPIPVSYTGSQHSNAGIDRDALVTGDGTRLVASFYRGPRRKVFFFTLTEFSVRTGKPVQVLYRRRTGHENESESELWVNTSGGTIIASRGESATSLQSVAGVQTPKAFTPFPPATQRLLGGGINNQPAW